VARRIRSHNFITTAGTKSDFAPHALDVFDEIYKAQSEALNEDVERPLKTTFNPNTMRVDRNPVSEMT